MTAATIHPLPTGLPETTLPEDLQLSAALGAWVARYTMHGVGDWERKQAADNLLAEAASVLHKFAMHSHDPLALGLEDPIERLNDLRHDIKGIDTEPDDGGFADLRATAADRAWADGRV